MTAWPEQPFAVGALVAPKSGGPAMIVAGYDADGDVECVHWSEAGNAFLRHAVAVEFLSPFGASPRDGEPEGQSAPAARAALKAAGLSWPFAARGGAVIDAQGARVCDALPAHAESDARAAAAARGIAAALNAIMQETCA